MSFQTSTKGFQIIRGNKMAILIQSYSFPASYLPSVN